MRAASAVDGVRRAALGSRSRTASWTVPSACPAPALSRPIIYGKYCLLERVSVGGMAEVFRARPFNQPGLRRFVAVKRILPNLADDDEFVRWSARS